VAIGTLFEVPIVLQQSPDTPRVSSLITFQMPDFENLTVDWSERARNQDLLMVERCLDTIRK